MDRTLTAYEQELCICIIFSRLLVDEPRKLGLLTPLLLLFLRVRNRHIFLVLATVVFSNVFIL